MHTLLQAVYAPSHRNGPLSDLIVWSVRYWVKIGFIGKVNVSVSLNEANSGKTTFFLAIATKPRLLCSKTASFSCTSAADTVYGFCPAKELQRFSHWVVCGGGAWFFSLFFLVVSIKSHLPSLKTSELLLTFSLSQDIYLRHCKKWSLCL